MADTTPPEHSPTGAGETAVLALDLGTTSLAGRLLDREQTLLAEVAMANPQGCVGADILTRLQRAHDGDGGELQSLLIGGLRELVQRLLSRSGLSAACVTAVAAAGNPGVSHLLRGLPVASLLFPPHKPADKILTSLSSEQVDLGLTVPLQLLPAVSGFVGGDLLAVLLSLRQPQAGTVCIDIGTNGELALWDGRQWWVTSAAAGPAFEAANISCGIPLGPGAVTDVKLQGEHMGFTVAGGGLPRGLCGSGLTALVASGLEGGLIDASGRVLAADEVESNLSRYLVEDEQGWAIRFYRDAVSDLRLTQEDVRSFQLAKGGMRAGLEVLLEQAQLSGADVAAVLVTGALGTALPVATLKRVALLPADMVDKTRFIPNGVLAGLGRFLVCPDGPQRLRKLISTTQPFPLSGTPRFERCFLAALGF